MTMKNIHKTSKYNPECAHTWDNQLDVHIIPCSSQRIEHNLLSSHLQQKSGLIGHPCRGPHLQNLDKPCQRRGNDFLPRKKKKKNKDRLKLTIWICRNVAKHSIWYSYLKKIRNFSPLFLGRVNPSWVVSTRVE